MLKNLLSLLELFPYKMKYFYALTKIEKSSIDLGEFSDGFVK